MSPSLFFVLGGFPGNQETTKVRPCIATFCLSQYDARPCVDAGRNALERKDSLGSYLCIPLRCVHASDIFTNRELNIMCGISGCMRAYKNSGRFRIMSQHFTGHGVLDGDNGTASDGEDGTVEFGGEMGSGGLTNAFQLCPAHSTASKTVCKDKHKLTQVALQGVIDLLLFCVDRMSFAHKLLAFSQLMMYLLQLPVTECLSGMFGQPFLSLETQHLQINYYRTNFHLNVSL